MSLLRDEGAEATVISQLLIIGITAGIVFVAATYAYFAVDTAINEADHSAAQLSLRGAVERIESLSQQGVNASTLVPLPQQGEVTFSSFSPPGRAPDRLVVTARPASSTMTMDGFTDGDALFDVDTDTSVVVTITWHWGLHQHQAPMGITESGTYSAPGDRQLSGVVSLVARDAADPSIHVLTVIIADLHTLTVETGSAEGIEAAAMVGNMVLNGPGHVTSQLHIQGTDALSLRLWALNGTSFASGGDQRLRVQVTGQAWLAQVEGLDSVAIQVEGPHSTGILALYQQHGAAIADGVATFDASRLDVHATALQGDAQR